MRDMRYTVFINETRKYRNEVKKIENNALRIDILNALDKIDYKAFKNEEFRDYFFLWLNKNQSTVFLRDRMKELGYDYWGNLKHQWIVDRLDSLHLTV